MSPFFKEKAFKAPLRLHVGPKAVSPCVWGLVVLEGSGSSCTSQYFPTTNFHFFKSKLVLTTINLGENLSVIQFLTGKVFSHRTEEYTMLVIISFCRYVKVIVVTMHWVLSLTVWIVLSISATCSLAMEVFTTTFYVRSSTVLSKSMSITRVCTIMLLLE